MRILIASRLFAPSVGGVETVVRLLAEEFTRMGHQVRVVTTTKGSIDGFAYEVIRIDSLLQLIKHAYWSDIVIQPNISLKFLWPCLILGKKIIVTHQQWYQGNDGRLRLIDRFKKWVARFTKNIVISNAIKEHLGQSAVLIPNPYDDKLFFKDDSIKREDSLVCVARLVSDKGVDLLLKAIKLLGDTAPTCTVIGDGPERSKLEQMSGDLGIREKVYFKGLIQGSELRKELNNHKIMVIPSRHGEPFGIVALEGIACGCIPIGTQGGGLGEAIGSCGIIVPNEDELALANAIQNLLADPSLLGTLLNSSKTHLRNHSSQEIASRYCRFIDEARV